MTTNFQFMPGDVIQEFETPFIKFLDVARKKWHCNCCFKRILNSRRCAGCKMVSYCDKNCQKTDWKIAHSVECKLFAIPQIASIVMVERVGIGDEIMKMIRLASFLTLHKEMATMKYQIFDGSMRCFNDLMDHCDAIKTDELRKKMTISLASYLADSKLFSELECSSENLFHLYGVWKTNAFGVTNEQNTEVIGSVLYHSSSMFDHSCRPNALRVMDESGRMQIRCIEAIALGEAPTITYLAGVRNRAERQVFLKKSFFFDCQCQLCETEKEGPVVNYDELLRLRAHFNQETIYNNDQFVRAKHILSEMQKIFCKYDERITNLYDQTLEKLVVSLTKSCMLKVSESETTNFAKTVEENLRITYGIEHKDYKYFAEELLPRLNAPNH